ncbi:MAG TPA: MBL fold metallo-hydrolase, partial [Candidatus Methylacidiphilales bacterium]
PAKISPEAQTVAFVFQNDQTGSTLLVAPDVFELNQKLETALPAADAVLFDGTFWSEDELSEVRPSARKASDMGHLPIKKGSLDLLAKLPARHRIYLHINNTNPIFRPGSLERRAVESAGVTIGHDGMEFKV